MRLPITIGGALMPDAHHGYGLPIGGVLATDNAVIPYGVGMDIGCRMCLSIFDLPAEFANRESYQLTEALKLHTRFGDKQFDRPISDDPIFVREEFKEIPFVRKLKDKAYKQLGSSGSGNHFVEFGIVEITEPDNEMGLELKRYFALLSHSGSRGFGANIAKHYTDIARERCLLPNEAKHLAWLSLNTEAGMEYWLAMNLAGDYASACHHQIHERMYRFLGEEPLAVIENHHNFAWKQTLHDGKEVIVHRKGATPANKGELGVIPGSMAAPGFIVRGKGNPQSLNSASHGAGRAMSRTKAKNSFTNSEMRKHLKQKGVKLIGGAIDESPFAYKDIHQVMQAQTDLVDVLGSFTPKIVRMDRAK
jgi:tRNA-splicing ligase RtcB